MQILIFMQDLQRSSKLIRSLVALKQNMQLGYELRLFANEALGSSPYDIESLEVNVCSSESDMLNRAALCLDIEQACIVCTDEIIPAPGWFDALKNIKEKQSDASCLFGRKYTDTLENKSELNTTELGFKYHDAVPELIADHIVDFTPNAYTHNIEVSEFPIFFNWFASNMGTRLQHALQQANTMEELCQCLADKQTKDDDHGKYYYTPELATIDQALLYIASAKAKA